MADGGQSLPQPGDFRLASRGFDRIDRFDGGRNNRRWPFGVDQYRATSGVRAATQARIV